MSTRSPWSEHIAPNGAKYYYNAITKQSTYTPPPGWPNPGAPPAPQLGPQHQPPPSEWKTYYHQGKPYYHNPRTGQTVWELPTASSSSSAAPSQSSPTPTATPTATPTTTTTTKPSASPSKPKRGGKPHYKNKQARQDAFTAMLDELQVPSDQPFEDAFATISQDERYNAVTKHNDRKRIYAEHMQRKRKEEKAAARVARKRARDRFLAMLTDTPTQDLPMHLSYTAFAHLHRDHEAMQDGTLSPQDKIDLFEDHMHTLESTHRRMRSTRHEQHALALHELYRQHRIHSWAQAQAKLANDKLFAHVHPYHALRALQDYLQRVGLHPSHSVRSLKQHTFRTERKRREAFATLLRSLADDGQWHARSPWADVLGLVRPHDAYTQLLGQLGSTPVDIWREVLRERQDIQRKQRAIVRDILAHNEFVVATDTTLDQLTQALADHPDTKRVNSALLPAILDDLRHRAQQDKDRKKVRFQRFVDLLKATPDIHYDTPWSTARDLLLNHPAFQDIEAEDERTTLYTGYTRVLRKHLAPSSSAAAGDKRPRDDDDGDEGRDDKRQRVEE